jgi:esterase
MKLYHKKLGEGNALIILHGLFGSSDNWLTIGRALSIHFEVWLIDLRNHGRSPHHSENSYDGMAADLLELMYDNHLDKAIIMGHSMGGKVAMNFALKNPNRVSHLIVLDIAPKSYLFSLKLDSETLNHKKIIEVMMNFDFANMKTREQLDIAFSKSIKSSQVRQFLLKNITRGYDDNFTWKINLIALYTNLNEILDGVTLNPESFGYGIIGFPVLFIKGGNSEYITPDDEEHIKRIFLYSQIISLSGAGHWLHVDQPDLLIQSIFDFLNVT